jgi:hypothetical protein
MKRVNVSGVYGGPDHKPQGVLDRHQQEIAAYLARARGPAESMTIKLRPRPSGETARVVFKEFDVLASGALRAPASRTVSPTRKHVAETDISRRDCSYFDTEIDWTEGGRRHKHLCSYYSGCRWF